MKWLNGTKCTREEPSMWGMVIAFLLFIGLCLQFGVATVLLTMVWAIFGLALAIAMVAGCWIGITYLLDQFL